MRDTTYGRDAEMAREEGRKGAAAARDDAMGELYCECCGAKRYGRDLCRECGAGKERRKECAKSDAYPKSLEEARKENGHDPWN